jgi:hypothetical protein
MPGRSGQLLTKQNRMSRLPFDAKIRFVNPLSPHVLRTLWYVDVLHTRGVIVTAAELDTFAIAEPPREALRHIWQFALGFNETALRKADPVAGYLFNIGWIKADGNGIELTAKGRAVLTTAGDEGSFRQAGEPEVVDIVLNPDDPMVFTHLTRRAVEAGAGMLVDPYFKADMLEWLTEATTLARVLISKKASGQERPLMAVALATLPRGNAVEVRFTESTDLHDRCLIAEDGAVRLIGASVTGIGRNQTSILAPDPAIMNAYRVRYENLWNSAERIEPQPVRTPPASGN